MADSFTLVLHLTTLLFQQYTARGNRTKEGKFCSDRPEVLQSSSESKRTPMDQFSYNSERWGCKIWKIWHDLSWNAPLAEMSIECFNASTGLSSIMGQTILSKMHFAKCSSYFRYPTCLHGRRCSAVGAEPGAAAQFREMPQGGAACSSDRRRRGGGKTEERREEPQ